MTSTAEKLMSLDEFLAWERDQPERHEFDSFIIVAMTGGSLDHSTIASNLDRRIAPGLEGSGCKLFRGDTKVIANGSVRYPDLTVTCSPAVGRGDIVPEPVLVVEVLSPSTQHIDRGSKKFDYFATPSIQQYVIIEQEERRVELYTRSVSGWLNEMIAGDGVLILSSIGVELSLDAIYRDTALDSTRRPAAGESSSAG